MKCRAVVNFATCLGVAIATQIGVLSVAEAQSLRERGSSVLGYPASGGAAGDPLPKYAVARLGSSRLTPGVPTQAVAFSRDARMLASASGELDRLKKSFIWDTRDGRLLKTRDLENERGVAGDVRPDIGFSADGSLVAIRGMTRVLLWNLIGDDGRQPPTDDYRHGLVGLDFSPDGRFIVWGSNDYRPPMVGQSKVVFWDTRTKTIAKEQHLLGTMRQLRFSPKGDELAIAFNDGSVGVWDLEGRKKQQILADDKLGRMAYSVDGSMLATTSDRLVTLWRADTGQRIVEMKATYQIEDVALSVGKVFAASGGTVFEWDLAGKLIHTWPTNQSVFRLALSPDGRLFATDGRATCLTLRETTGGKDAVASKRHSDAICCAQFVGNGGTIASLGMGDQIIVWDAATGAVKNQISIENTPPRITGPQRLATTRRHQLIAFCVQGTGIEIWQAGEDKPQKTLKARKEQDFLSLAFSPDGCHLAAGDVEGRIKVWDVASGKELLSATACANRSERKKLASLIRGSPEPYHPTDCWGIHSLAWAPDGKTILAAIPDVTLWVDVATGAIGKRFVVSPGSKNRYLEYSSDGSVIADFQCCDCHLRNASDGRVLLTIKDLWSNVVAMSPRDAVLAVAEPDGTIRLIEVPTGKQLTTVAGHRGTVESLAFSHDGRLLATGGSDTTILLWDIDQILHGRGSKRWQEPSKRQQ